MKCIVNNVFNNYVIYNKIKLKKFNKNISIKNNFNLR